MASLRSLTLRVSSSPSSFLPLLQRWKLGLPTFNHAFFSSSVDDFKNKELLELQEVEKVLNDVRADNVKVIPVQKHCPWTDFMVIATGKSSWHLRNIAEALIYKAGSFILISITLGFRLVAE